jgi:transposase
MRGQIDRQGSLFVVISLQQRVPATHPLRAIKRRCDELLVQMNRQFNRAYSSMGRPSIPPEQLLKALLVQALYSVRSERALMEQIEFNQLFRWFVDLPLEQRAWTPEVFSMNRQRFADHGLIQAFFDALVRQAVVEGYVSDEHFSVDGTLIRSWASLKSLQPKDTPTPPEPPDDPGNPTVNFHGQRRTNATHVSRTDPEARLARKGHGEEAQLCHSAHVLMENRHGLCVAASVDAADGQAERRQARALLTRVKRRQRLHPRTLGMDTGYDDGQFLADLERAGVLPHMPLRRGRIVAQDVAGQARRRARWRQRLAGYAVSQRIRKRIEEIFGWCKTVGRLARTRLVGRWKIAQEVLVTLSAYNLVRLVTLEAREWAPPVT